MQQSALGTKADELEVVQPAGFGFACVAQTEGCGCRVIAMEERQQNLAQGRFRLFQRPPDEAAQPDTVRPAQLVGRRGLQQDAGRAHAKCREGHKESGRTEYRAKERGQVNPSNEVTITQRTAGAVADPQGEAPVRATAIVADEVAFLAHFAATHRFHSITLDTSSLTHDAVEAGRFGFSALFENPLVLACSHDARRGQRPQVALSKWETYTVGYNGSQRGQRPQVALSPPVLEDS